ncbi:MAG: FHA domain-containing protein, partial [Planctomycetota bacterium]
MADDRGDDERAMDGSGDYTLIIRTEDGSAQSKRLHGRRFLIGRHRSADVVLDHPAVSRRHAELYRDPFDRWWVRDLDSRHGVYVNDRPVRERPLTESDSLRIGQYSLSLRSPMARSHAQADASMPTVPFAESVGDEGVSEVDSQIGDALTGDRLRALVALNGELNAEPDADARRKRLCDTLVAQFPADAAAMLLCVSAVDDGTPPARLAASERRGSNVTRHVSRTLLNVVREKRRAALASNVALPVADARLSITVGPQPLMAMACPLDEMDGDLIVLYVIMESKYAGGEWLSFVSMAGTIYRQAEATHRLHGQLTAHEIIERDLTRARKIQDRLLPRDLSCEGWDIAIGFEPCRWVGGDYVDVVRCADGRLLLVVADVCGKGLAAALTTGNVHAVVHANAQLDLPLAEFIRNVNAYLCDTLLDDSFVTMLAARLDPAAGALEAVSAGHPRPLRFNRTGA